MIDAIRAARPFARRFLQLRSPLAAFAAAAMLLAAFPVRADDNGAAASAVEFNIPAQPVAAALNEFAKQARVQLLFISNGFEAVEANPVVGTYDTQYALDLLLDGTGLAARISGDSEVRIRKVPSSDSSSFVPPRALPSEQSVAAYRPRQTSEEDRPANTSEPEMNSREPKRLEEIVVTGTSIRGVIPESTPLEIFDATDIRNTGALTAEQFIATLPQNNNTLTEIGSGNSSRETNGQATNSVDLRGLGVGTTLVLLNGRRIAPSARGRTPDLSFIPLAAVERIEVLSDGASAIYGADAIGGVVNFVLKDKQDGAATVLTFGGADGGSETLRLDQSFGLSWENGEAFLALSYMDRNELDANDRSYSVSASPSNLIPQDNRKNLLVTVSQQLPLEVTVSGDLLLAARQPLLLRRQSLSSRLLANDIDSDQIMVNVEAARPVGNRHDAALQLTYSRSGINEETTRLDLTGSEMGQTLRSDDAKTFEATIKLDGGLLTFRGQDWLYATGAGLTKDDYAWDIDNTGVGGRTVSSTSTRDTRYAFAEFFLPLIGEQDDIPGLRRLELTLATRYTDYSDFGGKSSPKLGVLWSPVPSLRVRGTLGESFKAPFLFQLDRSTSDFLLFRPADLGFPDIWTADGSAVMLMARGRGNPNAGPEEARTFTAGFDLDLANLMVSATYFNIDYTDRLGEPDPSGGFVVLGDPQEFPELFDTAPSLQQVSNIASTLIPSNLTEIDVSDPAAIHAATTVYFDNRVQNLSTTKLDALDVSIQYSTESRLGTIDLGVRASRIFGFEERARADAAEIPRLNTVLFPVDLKARAHIGLQRERWNARLNLNYTDEYTNPFDDDDPAIDAWTTFDLVFSRYFHNTDNEWWNGLRLGLSVQNVLDEKPPFVALGTTTNTGLLEAIGFDPANANPLGRFVTLQLTKEW